MLSEDDVEIAEGLANTAKGMRFLARMRAISGGDPIPVNIGDGTRGMTREQWNDAMKDAIKAKDYREQERLEELGKMINGEEASHGGRPGGFTAEKTVARR